MCRSAKIVGLAGAWLFVACGDARGSRSSPGKDAGSVAAPAASGTAAYKAAAARWKAKAQRDYVFVVSTVSFSDISHVRNTVVDGSSVSARSYQDSMPRATTIDDWLTEVQTDIAKHPDTLEITYDETWGYPAEINFDATEAADDESHTTITCFVPGPDNGLCPL